MSMHAHSINGKDRNKKDLKTIDSCKKESGSSVSSDGDELFAVLSERGLETVIFAKKRVPELFTKKIEFPPSPSPASQI